jgi:lactate permease
MLTLIAIAPLILLITTIVLFRWPAYIAALITSALTLIGAYFLWGVPLITITAGITRGALVTVEIILIIFGALLLLKLLEQAGVISHIERVLSHVSPDKRIQSLLIAWFFVAFIEGAAGFGTPAALAAPLLVSLGFHPITAVLVCLIGDSVPVTYGAVGLPITLGIFGGLTAEQQAAYGGSLIPDVTFYTVLLHVLISSFIPVLIVTLTSLYEHRTLRGIFPFVGVAVGAGLCLTIPMYLIGTLLGPEFPALLGSGIGLCLFIPLVYLVKRYLPAPAHTNTKTAHSTKKVSPAEHKQRNAHITAGMIARIFAPYAVVSILLILTRLNVFGLRDFTEQLSLRFPELFGTEVSASLNILYSPGISFLAACVFAVFLYRLSRKDAAQAVQTSLKRIVLPGITVFCILTVVQIFIYSGTNTFDYPSMPVQVAQQLSAFGTAYPVFAPFVGVVGAFIAGSATVSNLLFSELQTQTAVNIGLPIVVILALQAMGSSIGNMVAVHNVVAASATVNATNQEYKILRITLVIALCMALIMGGVGLVLVRLSG